MGKKSKYKKREAKYKRKAAIVAAARHTEDKKMSDIQINADIPAYVPPMPEGVHGEPVEDLGRKYADRAMADRDLSDDDQAAVKDLLDTEDVSDEEPVVMAAVDDLQPHDHKDKWDRADTSTLKALVIQGYSRRQIADRMGRTMKAVDSKIYRLRKVGWRQY